MSQLRKEVLSGYKSLLRAARIVFLEDDLALGAARAKINEGFKKNKHVKDSASISEMIKFAKEVERELKTSVVQAREKVPGVFELGITKDTNLLDNVEFKEDAALPPPRKRPQQKK